MVKIVNLTPHTINLMIGEGSISIEPSGIIARCKVSTEQVGTIKVDGKEIPVNKKVYGEVEGLPEKQEGTIYIVSSLVAQAVKDRDDVFIPDELVRDEEGRVIGARALAKC